MLRAAQHPGRGAGARARSHSATSVMHSCDENAGGGCRQAAMQGAKAAAWTAWVGATTHLAFRQQAACGCQLRPCLRGFIAWVTDFMLAGSSPGEGR